MITLKCFTIALVIALSIIGIYGRPNAIFKDDGSAIKADDAYDEEPNAEMESLLRKANRIKLPHTPAVRRHYIGRRPIYGRYPAPPLGHYYAPRPYYYGGLGGGVPYPALGANYIY